MNYLKKNRGSQFTNYIKNVIDLCFSIEIDFLKLFIFANNNFGD